MLDFRVGSNWLILCLLNFEGCQLWHQLSQKFLHQFQKFLCPLCCKFSEFSKASPLHYILMILKEVMTKNQKIKKSEDMPISANPEIQPFFRVKFFNFFFIPMPKEYQSEKSPIFDSQKSPKTLRKLHIMSQLYAAKVCQLFCNTRQIYPSFKVSRYLFYCFNLIFVYELAISDI